MRRTIGASIDRRRRIRFRDVTNYESQAAATVCYVAAHPKVAGVTGKYFADCNEALCSSSANDETQARILWDFSEQITCNHRRIINDSAQQQQQQRYELALRSSYGPRSEYHRQLPVI
jgi:hypothetical protein